MSWKDEIPWLGWHPDNTLIWHTLRDAGITLAAGLVCWIFVDLLQDQDVINTNYPIHWIIGVAGGYFFRAVLSQTKHHRHIFSELETLLYQSLVRKLYST